MQTCADLSCHLSNAAGLYLRDLAIILMGAGAAGLLLRNATEKLKG